jgi:hypothetical protein
MANVEPGSYVVFGKATLVQLSGGDSHNPYTRCTLDTGGSSDYAESDPKVNRATLQAQTVATLTTPGTITFTCLRVSDRGTWVAREAKIIAIQVGSATNDAG